MKGKEKCRILKEIRRSIAEENGIEFITSECKHKGDCKGTCPKCESEVRYLERELEKKQRLGKTIAIAGIAAGLVLSSVGCADEPVVDELGGDIAIEDVTDGIIVEPDEPLMGEPEIDAPDVPYIDENGNEAILPEGEIIAGELPEYFFAEKPEDYDEYPTNFIDSCLAGKNISEIREVWGEEDMSQVQGDRGIIAYFTNVQDIVIQYEVETGDVINVTTIENYE